METFKAWDNQRLRRVKEKEREALDSKANFMELVVTVLNKEQLNRIKDYTSYVLLDDPDFSSYGINDTNICELIELANSYNITPIIKLNAMLHPDMLKLFKDKLLGYKNYNCLFLVTDLGACNIALRLGLEARIIYDPVTMITNSLDATIYNSYGFNALGLSEEITLEDVNTIVAKTKLNAYYQIFGYHLMMHSYRKLISLFEEYKGISIPSKILSLEEQTRKDIYPILENKNGTFVFRSYVISLLKNLKSLNIKYGVLDGFNLDFEVYLKVVEIYYSYLNNQQDLTTALNNLSLLNLKIEDGFSYKDSEYKKEDLKL